MNYHDHAFIDATASFDITEQLNAYNESLMMNSNATPDLQTEEQHQQLTVSNSDPFAIDDIDDDIDDDDDDDDYYYYESGDQDDYQAAVFDSLYEESPNANLNYHHRPLSGYNMFLRDHGKGRSKTTLVLQGRKPPTNNGRGGSSRSSSRSSSSSMSLPPTMPEMMAQAWNGLSPAARAHYQGLAQQERNQYLAAARKKKNETTTTTTTTLPVPVLQKTTTTATDSSSMMMMTTTTTTTMMNTNNQSSMPLPLPIVQAPQPTMLAPSSSSSSPPPQQQQQHQQNNIDLLQQLRPVVDCSSHLLLLEEPPPPAIMAPKKADLAFMTPNYRRAIADLASKLDDASIDFLIRAFK